VKVPGLRFEISDLRFVIERQQVPGVGLRLKDEV
jgi:hypothetical protein